MSRNASLIIFTAAASIFASGSVQAESIFDTVATVVSSHPQVAGAAKLVSAAEASSAAAISGFFPVVSVDGRIGYEVTEQSSSSAELDTRQINLSLTQPLLGGIATESQVRSKKAGVDAAEFELNTRQISVGFQAVQVYLDVLSARETARVAASYRQRIEALGQRLRARAEADPGLLSDVTVAQSRLLEAGVNAVAARTGLELAESLFAELVGHRPAQLEAVDLSRLALPGTLEEALFGGQFSHPAVRAASARFDQMMAEHDVEAAGLLPQLNLRADARFGDNVDGVPGKNNSFFVGLQFGGSLDLGGGGIYRSQASRLRAEAAAEDENNTILLVRQQIQRVWSEWETADAILKATTERRKNSDKMVADYEGQFTAGTRDLLDFFFVLSEQHVAEEAEIAARYNRLASAFKLLAAMGSIPGMG